MMGGKPRRDTPPDRRLKANRGLPTNKVPAPPVPLEKPPKVPGVPPPPKLPK